MEEIRQATKQDLLDFKRDVHESFLDVRRDLTQLEHKLTIRMGTMLAASIAVLTALQKLV